MPLCGEYEAPSTPDRVRAHALGMRVRALSQIQKEGCESDANGREATNSPNE